MVIVAFSNDPTPESAQHFIKESDVHDMDRHIVSPSKTVGVRFVCLNSIP